MSAIQNLPPFISPLQYENYEVPRFADRGSPPTLSNLSATIPFNIALFISIFIAHYNVALLKKAIDFRIDRGESQLFGSICRRIHSTYIRQRRLLPHSNQWQEGGTTTYFPSALLLPLLPYYLVVAGLPTGTAAVGQLFFPKTASKQPPVNIEAALRRNPYNTAFHSSSSSSSFLHWQALITMLCLLRLQQLLLRPPPVRQY